MSEFSVAAASDEVPPNDKAPTSGGSEQPPDNQTPTIAPPPGMQAIPNPHINNNSATTWTGLTTTASPELAEKSIDGTATFNCNDQSTTEPRQPNPTNSSSKDTPLEKDAEEMSNELENDASLPKNVRKRSQRLVAAKSVRMDPTSIVPLPTRRRKRAACKTVASTNYLLLHGQTTENLESWELCSLPAAVVHEYNPEEILKLENKRTKKSAEKKQRKPTATKKPKAPPKTPKTPRARARVLSEGAPTEPLEGGWPSGWKSQLVARVSGATKGQTDRYWYSPGGKKFRSMVEVRRFMQALKTADGDEVAAYRLAKNK